MKFLREDEVPVLPGDPVFREAVVWNFLWMLGFLAVAVGLFADLAWPGYLGADIPDLMVYVAGGGAGLMAPLAHGMARAGLKRSNWIMRAGVGGLYIKFRSYLNHRFDPGDAVVVWLTQSDVRWIRERVEHQEKPGSERGASSTHRVTWLEIQLRDPDTTELERRVVEESRRMSPRRFGVSGRSKHSPLLVKPGGLLRVQMPRPRRAIEVLSRSYAAEAAEKTRHKDFDDLTRDEQEARILAFTEQGDVIAAVKLTKLVYGYGTTEAKAFVEGLRDK